jgi:hypothetical protein
MKRLTKKVRHNIYVYALEHFKHGGLCSMIWNAVQKCYPEIYKCYPNYADDSIGWPWYGKNNDGLKNYPELYKHKPKGDIGAYWFTDDQAEIKRKRILEQAIKETA